MEGKAQARASKSEEEDEEDEEGIIEGKDNGDSVGGRLKQ